MIERLKESRWIYVLISLCLGLVFWLYVRNTVNPAQEGTVYNVPVEVVGERVLEERGLAVASLSHDTMNVRVKAPVTVLSDLGRSGLVLAVDVSQCHEAGIYKLEYSPKLPTNIDTTGTYFPNQGAQTVTVKVETLATKRLPVELKLEGNVAEGYQAGSAVFDPELIEIRGTQTQVEGVKRAVAVLRADNLDRSFEGKLPVTLLDESGRAIVDGTLKLSEEAVYVRMSIGMIKEVALTVQFAPGGGATAEDVTYEIQPATITVVGSQEELQGLTEVSLGTIDLSTVIGSTKVTRPILLSPTLEHLEGVTEATIQVKIREGLATKPLNVTNIETINVPEGYTAEVKTKERIVVVRGKAEELEGLDASNIRIVADLSGITATGTINVDNIRVYLNAGEEVGVVGTYSIVVTMSR